MNEDEKRIEISINADGFSFRKTNPHPLTAEQKYSIIMAVFALILFGLCVRLIRISVSMCDFPGFLFSLVAVVVLFAVILFKLDY